MIESWEIRYQTEYHQAGRVTKWKFSIWGNDHRWTATFHPTLGIKTHSKSFNQKSEQNWVAKLQEVHSYAWETWSSQLAQIDQYRLEVAKTQTPGILPDGVVQALNDTVTSMPPPKKYTKAWRFTSILEKVGAATWGFCVLVMGPMMYLKQEYSATHCFWVLRILLVVVSFCYYTSFFKTCNYL